MTRVGTTSFSSIPALSGTGGLGGQNNSPVIIGSLCDIADVDCTYLTEGDVLEWNGYVWTPQAGGGGRWELAVISGSPPDSLYADGDWLYILVS